MQAWVGRGSFAFIYLQRAKYLTQTKHCFVTVCVCVCTAQQPPVAAQTHTQAQRTLAHHTHTQH